MPITSFMTKAAALEQYWQTTQQLVWPYQISVHYAIFIRRYIGVSFGPANTHTKAQQCQTSCKKHTKQTPNRNIIILLISFHHPFFLFFRRRRPNLSHKPQKTLFPSSYLPPEKKKREKNEKRWG